MDHVFAECDSTMYVNRASVYEVSSLKSIFIDDAERNCNAITDKNSGPARRTDRM